MDVHRVRPDIKLAASVLGQTYFFSILLFDNHLELEWRKRKLSVVQIPFKSSHTSPFKFGCNVDTYLDEHIRIDE